MGSSLRTAYDSRMARATNVMARAFTTIPSSGNWEYVSLKQENQIIRMKYLNQMNNIALLKK
jgi:hypothetical protein